jgi:hypothetical protein
MPVKVLKNNIQTPRFAAAVQGAVLLAIGDRDGAWEVEIHHFTRDESYKILIVGPLPFGVWQRTFKKSEGATLGQIRQVIESAMPPV